MQSLECRSSKTQIFLDPWDALYFFVLVCIKIEAITHGRFVIRDLVYKEKTKHPLRRTPLLPCSATQFFDPLLAVSHHAYKI